MVWEGLEVGFNNAAESSSQPGRVVVTRWVAMKTFGTTPSAKLISPTPRIDSKHSWGSKQASKIEILEKLR